MAFDPIYRGSTPLEQVLPFIQLSQRQKELDWRRQQEAQRNALEEEQRRLAMERQQGMTSALSQLFSPQRAQGTGPMRGVQSYQPGRMEAPTPSRQQVMAKMAPYGVEGIETALALAPRTEYQIIDGQYVPKTPGGQARPIPGFQQKPDVQIMETAEGIYRVPKRGGAAERVEGLTPKAALERQNKEIENARKLRKENFDSADKLRDEYTKGSGDFVKIRDAYGRIQASVTEPSAAGDLALIFNYMKMLDPGSVVRESEFQTAALTGGYGERIKAAVERISTGERLSPAMRADFTDRSRKLYGQTTVNQKKLDSEYRRLANRFGIAPEDVIVDFNSIAEKGGGETPPPKPPAEMSDDELLKALGG